MKFYISHLRNLATFGVILLHSTSAFLYEYNKISIASWTTANFIDSFSRFCVPVFVMISGALLLGSKDSLFHFLNKRIKRILIPFIFWSVIYFLWRIYWENISLEKEHLMEFLKISIRKGSSYHLWYLYMIIGLYFFIPIVKPWIQNANKKEIKFFLLLWMVTLILPLFTASYFPQIELIYFSKYVGYLILGYYLDRYIIINSKSTWLSVLCIIVGGMFTFMFTQLSSVENNKFISLYYNYDTINVALLSTGIFVLGKKMQFSHNRIMTSLDKNSFGIYFIHPILLALFIYLIPYSSFQDSIHTTIIYIVFCAMLIFFISFILISLSSKIPVVKRLIQ